MCAINPTHKKRFIVDVYTSHKMTKDNFGKDIMGILLKNEQFLNERYGAFRFHLKESQEEAD